MKQSTFEKQLNVQYTHALLDGTIEEWQMMHINDPMPMLKQLRSTECSFRQYVWITNILHFVRWLESIGRQITCKSRYGLATKLTEVRLIDIALYPHASKERFDIWAIEQVPPFQFGLGWGNLLHSEQSLITNLQEFLHVSIPFKE